MTSSESRTHAAVRVPLRVDDHEGAAAVFIPRWTTAARTGRLVLAVIVLGCAASGLVAALAAEWGVALFLAGTTWPTPGSTPGPATWW